MEDDDDLLDVSPAASPTLKTGADRAGMHDCL